MDYFNWLQWGLNNIEKFKAILQIFADLAASFPWQNIEGMYSNLAESEGGIQATAEELELEAKLVEQLKPSPMAMMFITAQVSAENTDAENAAVPEGAEVARFDGSRLRKLYELFLLLKPFLDMLPKSQEHPGTESTPSPTTTQPEAG